MFKLVKIEGVKPCYAYSTLSRVEYANGALSEPNWVLAGLTVTRRPALFPTADEAVAFASRVPGHQEHPNVRYEAHPVHYRHADGRVATISLADGEHQTYDEVFAYGRDGRLSNATPRVEELFSGSGWTLENGPLPAAQQVDVTELLRQP
jgi:hypothetical protein